MVLHGVGNGSFLLTDCLLTFWCAFATTPFYRKHHEELAEDARYTLVYQGLYLNHQCSDADTGIILDVSVTGGNGQDCECYVERYAYLKNEKHYPIRSTGLDSGYVSVD